LTKTLSSYLGLSAARELRGIDYFDLRAAFFAIADLDLIADAALYARLTSVFLATGDDFIVRTVMTENRPSPSRFAKRKRPELEIAVPAPASIPYRLIKLGKPI
jgi:hypothetical protein